MTNRQIASSSQPTTRTEAASIIGALGRMFAGFRERSEEAAALVQVYASALDDLPAWAVVQSCDDFVRGSVPGRKTQAFAPAVAEIHEHASALVEKRREAETLRLPGPALRSRDELTAERMARLRASLKAWETNPPPGPLAGFEPVSMSSPTPEEA
jgi:hypothetical protein